MITAAKLAGYVAAHAVWTLADADTFTPMLAYTNADKKCMDRLIGDDTSKVVLHGKQRLEDNKMHADDAVLVFDGRIPLRGATSDAIIIEMRTYSAPAAEAIIAVPYTKDAELLRVHRPKLLVWKECDDFDMDYTIEQFFAGVEENDEGAAIWNENLDDSR